MASNGAEAVWSAAETEPDVAILDVMMPKVDGIKVTHQIRQRHPETTIVVISAYEDLSFIADLMRNGVGRKAYLLKHSISDIAYRRAGAGSGIRLRRAYGDGLGNHSEDGPAILQVFWGDRNRVERDGARRICAGGYDDDLICETLRLGQTQIEEHSASMYAKFGISGGSPSEQRIAVVQVFVGQIHKIPLSKAYDAVG